MYPVSTGAHLDGLVELLDTVMFRALDLDFLRIWAIGVFGKKNIANGIDGM